MKYFGGEVKRASRGIVSERRRFQFAASPSAKGEPGVLGVSKAARAFAGFNRRTLAQKIGDRWSHMAIFWEGALAKGPCQSAMFSEN